MFDIKEYELGERARIRLWAVRDKMGHGKLLIIMEEGELMFFSKEDVGKISMKGNLE